MEVNAERYLEVLLDVVFEFKRGEESSAVRANAKKVVEALQKWRESAELSEEETETANDGYAFYSRV